MGDYDYVSSCWRSPSSGFRDRRGVGGQSPAQFFALQNALPVSRSLGGWYRRTDWVYRQRYHHDVVRWSQRRSRFWLEV